ncbi:CoA pyrophosphatase [Alteromonas sp. CYL-A6]|uniref:CoA pyrophosphatase n=1 Tax=Alteromonas nitratireducens TaxID=3390813 RepID=UPI0034AEF32B
MTKQDFLRRFHHLRQITHEPDYPLKKRAREAAVLIPLLDHTTHLEVILTQRASHLRSHPGQISFPGGAAEPGDKDSLDTALREAREEIGLPPERVQCLGSLPDYRTISGFVIKPVIGSVTPGFDYVIDTNEVDSVFTAPLDFLMDKRNHFTYHFERQGQRFPLYFIQYKDRLIWGATAAMLRNLAHHLDLSDFINQGQ